MRISEITRVDEVAMPSFAQRFPAERITTLRTMLPRGEQAFVQWLGSENGIGADPEHFKEAMHDAELLLEYFDEWLGSEHSISVREDGLIEFWILDRNTQILIGDLPVALFHYTSSALRNKIKKSGLHSHGKRAWEDSSGAGVYLTTEQSGRAVEAYVMRAVRAHGRRSRGIKVTVKAFLGELSPDPDDQDIQSGRHQFVVNYVPPGRVVEINNA